MSLMRAFKRAALLACLCPASALAAEDVYLCQDDKGVPENVRVDYSHKRVTMFSGRSPGQCAFTFTDGAVGPSMTAPPGNSCIWLILSPDQPSLPQYVRFEGDDILFGANAGDHGSISGRLNTRTGILDVTTPNSTSMDECHRAHA